MRLGLPPIVADKIHQFIQAGNSGTIILQVRDGRVLAFELHDKGSVPREEEPTRS